MSSAVVQSELTVSHRLGEMVWLLSQSPKYQQLRLADLEWMVMPAILLQQYHLFYDDQFKPTALALWVSVSQPVEERIKELALRYEPMVLTVEERRSGDRLWLLELVAPFATRQNQQAEKLLITLKANLFNNQPFRFARAAELVLPEDMKGHHG